jgi:hypothetical protein
MEDTRNNTTYRRSGHIYHAVKGNRIITVSTFVVSLSGSIAVVEAENGPYWDYVMEGAKCSRTDFETAYHQTKGKIAKEFDIFKKK